MFHILNAWKTGTKTSIMRGAAISIEVIQTNIITLIFIIKIIRTIKKLLILILGALHNNTTAIFGIVPIVVTRRNPAMIIQTLVLISHHG